MFIVTAVRKSKVRGKCNLLFKKIVLSRSAVHAVSWLQMAATFMAATSDAGKRSFLKRQLTSESKIGICLRSEDSKGIVC